MGAGEGALATAPLKCSGCGAIGVIAVKPCSEDEHGAGILLRRGTPDRAWCLACWPVLRPADGPAQ
jgi:hypothetical protein